jgi:transcriptional regulator with XRE-family HTH domain
MDSNDPFWTSEHVVALVRAHDVGGLVRLVRKASRLTQSDLAPLVNVSTSTLSRFENGSTKWADLPLAKALAERLKIPSHLLGAAWGIGGVVSPSVTLLQSSAEEDPIHRRSFLTLAGLALPAALLGKLDNALAGVAPGLDVAPGELHKKLAVARGMYDRGQNGMLLGCLPELLTLADQELDIGNEASMLRYCIVNDLATDVLDKVGLVSEARVTAQNSIRVSRQAGSPLAMAAADRGLTIVLRHEGKLSTANLVSLRAANLIEQTGLVNSQQAIAYVQVMCTHAYVAAQNCDRGGALSAIGEAERAAAYLAQRAPEPVARRATANARMYRVSMHWALGDAGTAVHVGNGVDVSALPTPERRARHCTDMARAWWAWGKPDETAVALLAALSYAPEEVRDRTRIRAIADELVHHHARLHSVGELRDQVTNT